MAWKMRVSLLLGPLFIFLVGLACATSEPTATPTATAIPTVTKTLTASIEWVEHTSETASYRIRLRTGPRVTEEVMMMEAGAAMTAVDRGQPVNRHLEVHVFSKSSGTEVKNLVPTVKITDQATGDSREFAANLHPSSEIPYVTACLLTNHRVREPHFGDNLHLSDGEYSVTVSVGDETAAFIISL